MKLDQRKQQLTKQIADTHNYLLTKNFNPVFTEVNDNFIFIYIEKITMHRENLTLLISHPQFNSLDYGDTNFIVIFNEKE